jgi:hypothetical protein
MKNKLLYLIVMAALLFAGSCAKDNKDAPDATIKGKVVYNNQPLGLRSNGVQLELWQDGYQLRIKIPVHISHDGSFSASVFDGNYKLTLLRGNGPWADKADTINVVVKGSTNVDVPVDPYFIIKNASFTKTGTSIQGNFNIQRVNTSKALELVRIYIGQTIITDQNNNAATAQKLAAAIPDISQPIVLNATIPAGLATKDYVYVRIGVKAVGVAELLYSEPVQLMIK